MSKRGSSIKKRSAENERYIERRERQYKAAKKRKAKQAKKQGTAIKGEINRHDIHS